jgi:hypothetical protein
VRPFIKKLLAWLACLASLTLSAFTTDFSPVEQQNFSNFTQSSDRTELGSQDILSTLAKRFGGRRGERMGPSSKRKDPNQPNEGNKKGSEHKKNQNQSNEESHQKGQDRKSDQNKRADEKNAKRHEKK